MQEVIEDVQRIIHITKVPAAALDFCIDKRKDLLKNGLAMSHNHALICLELLDHYFTFWKDRSFLPSCEIDATRQEHGGRIIEATKGMFLFCLSAMEFSMKHALKINPHPLTRPDKKIKLSRLLKESFGEQIITKEDFYLWEGIVNIRNSVVHNNGIWEDEDKIYKYPNGLSISLKNKSMTQGNLRVFSQLTEWTIAAYLQWSISLMLCK